MTDLHEEDNAAPSWRQIAVRALGVALVVFGGVALVAYLVSTRVAGEAPEARAVHWPPPITAVPLPATPAQPYAPLDPAVVSLLARGLPFEVQPAVVLPGVAPLGSYVPHDMGRTLGQLQTPRAPVIPPMPTRPIAEQAQDDGILPTPTPALSALGGPALEAYAGEGCAPRGLPTGGLLTQYYHAWHSGVDYGIPVGTPVTATHSAQVVFAGWSAVGYGNLVILQNGTYITYYAHLSRFNVVEGQLVGAGSVIAWSGNTGNSTGPHIHYEVRINDIPVDPLTFDSRGHPWC